jgi:hypothetical protein
VGRFRRAGQRVLLVILATAGLGLLGYGLAAGIRVGPTSMASPTPALPADRLLEPTLPPNPTTADLGSRVYWLYCMPCHGDRGQGLTVEFREVYPPEDRNCWASKCHGDVPYPGGFTLPTQVPPVIGEGALQNFASVTALSGFIRAAMPRQAPGSLSPELYDQLMAFLVRENGLPVEDPGPAGAAPAGAATVESVPHPLAPLGNDRPDGPSSRSIPVAGWVAAGMLLLALGAGLAFRWGRKRSNHE